MSYRNNSLIDRKFCSQRNFVVFHTPIEVLLTTSSE